MLMSISKDEQERAKLRNRRIALADHESNMITAKRVAREEGYREADEKWQGVIADKDVRIAELEAQLAKRKHDEE